MDFKWIQNWLTFPPRDATGLWNTQGKEIFVGFFFSPQKDQLMKRYQSLHNIQIIIWMQIKQAI